MFGSILIDGLADMDEGSVVDLEEIFLQLIFDILDQQLISDILEFLLELPLLLIIHDRDEYLIDKPQRVATHQNVVCVVNSLSKGFQQGVMSILFLEHLQALHDGYAVLDLPTIVLQHQQHVGCDGDVDWVVGPQQDDRVVGYGADRVEVFLGAVVREGLQELQDLDLILEDGLGAHLVVGDGLVQDLH